MIQQPSPAATAGAGFTVQPVVAEEDEYNNIITSDSTSKVTAARGNLGTAALQGTSLTVTLVKGVATFAGLFYDKAETLDLAFTTNAANVTSTGSNDVVVSPAAPSQLKVAQQPTTATAGAAFTPQPIVDEEDPYGNLETGDNTTDVMASLATGSGLSGTLTATVAGGVATFTNLSDDTAQSITLQFTSGSLTPAISSNIVINPAPADQVVFGQQPTNTTAGVAITPAVTVKVEDAYGNVITTDTSTVTLTLSSGTFAGDPIPSRRKPSMAWPRFPA